MNAETRQAWTGLSFDLFFSHFHRMTNWTSWPGTAPADYLPCIADKTSQLSLVLSTWLPLTASRPIPLLYNIIVIITRGPPSSNKHSTTGSGVQTRRLIHTDTGLLWYCLCVTCSFLSTHMYIHGYYKDLVSPRLYIKCNFIFHSENLYIVRTSENSFFIVLLCTCM